MEILNQFDSLNNEAVYGNKEKRLACELDEQNDDDEEQISNDRAKIKTILNNADLLMLSSRFANAETANNKPKEEHVEQNNSNFEKLFDSFLNANTSKSIVKSFEHICKCLKINADHVFEHGHKIATPNQQLQMFHQYQPYSRYHDTNKNHITITTRLIYQIIKSKTDYWKANELWKKYDKKLTTKCYKKESNNKANKDLNVLIIGCGPVGLRLSIECALLGHKCTIVEKRDRFSRNNVLHLWPYTIVDLKNLGAKLFYGKFCAGSIDHISIRKLQCVLLKVALLVGVKVHFNTSFEEILEPDDQNLSWRVRLLPENHPLEKKHFDVIVGADGRRNSLPGFNRKEFRGRLAIGITANFVNYNSAEEAEVQERSGVAFIFDQKFFLDLREETGIDLENIVYYKDDTHYFVMTAKRQSLIDKGVIKKDFPEASLLLSKENVNFDKLCEYAKEAAYVSTNKQLKRLDFAKNHYGQPDVAMFDFTSLFQAENASRIVERKGCKLMMALVGDSLLEPFWPTGTGIARGFLAAFDTAWMIKGFGQGKDAYNLLCERESIYQLLSQTTHENVSKNYQEYSLDPNTRYLKLNFNLKMLQVNQIRHLYDNSSKPLYSIDQNSTLNQNQPKTKDLVNSTTLLHWCQMVLQPYNIKVDNFTSSWKDGLAFLAIIHRFRPDLIDYNTHIQNEPIVNVKSVFDLMRNKLTLAVEASPEEFNNNTPNKFTVLMILDKLYSIFKNQALSDIENIHLDSCEVKNNESNNKSNLKRKLLNQDENFMIKKNNLIKSLTSNSNNNNSSNSSSSKFNNLNNFSVNNIASVLKNKIEFFNNKDKNTELANSNNSNNNVSNSNADSSSNHSSTTCYVCEKKVYLMERHNVMDFFLHINCFRCSYCSRLLRNGYYESVKDESNGKFVFYCINHVSMSKNHDNKNDFKHSSKKNSETRRNSFIYKKNEDSDSGKRRDSKYDFDNVYSKRECARVYSQNPEKTETFAPNKYQNGLRERAEFESVHEYNDESAGSDDDGLSAEDELNNRDELFYDEDNKVEFHYEMCAYKTTKKNYRNSFNAKLLQQKGDDYKMISHTTTNFSATNRNNKSNLNRDFVAVRRPLTYYQNYPPDTNEILNERKFETNSSHIGKFKQFNQKSDDDFENQNYSAKSQQGFLQRCVICKSNIANSENVRKVKSYTCHYECMKCFVCDENLENRRIFPQINSYNNVQFFCFSHASKKAIKEASELPQLEKRDELNKLIYPDANQCKKEDSPESKEISLSTNSHEDDSENINSKPENNHGQLQTNYNTDSSRSNHSQEKLDTDECNDRFSVFRASNFPTVKNSSDQDKNQPSKKEEKPEEKVTEIINKQQNVILDVYLIRQKALEKARLKSDEELGVDLPENIKKLISPATYNNDKTEKQSVVKKMINDQEPKLDISSKKTSHQGEKQEQEQDPLVNNTKIDNMNAISIEITNAPLAESEVFDNFDELANAGKNDDDNRDMPDAKPFKKSQLLTLSPKLSLSHSMDLFSSLRKLPSNAKPSLSPILKLFKPTSPSSTFKKSCNTTTTTTSIKTNDFSASLSKISGQSNKKKKLVPNIDFFSEPFVSSISSLISDHNCTFSDDDKDSERPSETTNKKPNADNLTSSFNALNITNSPRLSKNSRMKKFNYKRQQNEERRLEKQRKDKRLRMSQEIQRKLDEIETRLDELQREGVELEKMICAIDSNDLTQHDRKDRLEQELYNLIHEKNLLTRVENELNIQSCALAIEDKLSECQSKLRETIDIPESEKSIDIMENEKLIMEKIVDLVEEKNKLVEQLESLRLMEQEEDNVVLQIFSGKIYNMNTSNKIINKYEPFRDII